MKKVLVTGAERSTVEDAGIQGISAYPESERCIEFENAGLRRL